MERLKIAVPGALLDVLRARALEEGVSFAEMARRALDLGVRRGALAGESAQEESLRLLAERAREGSVPAAVAYARLVAKGEAPAGGSSDPDDELAAKRKRR
jgi:hypothetical protein